MLGSRSYEPSFLPSNSKVRSLFFFKKFSDFLPETPNFFKKNSGFFSTEKYVLIFFNFLSTRTIHEILAGKKIPYVLYIDYFLRTLEKLYPSLSNKPHLPNFNKTTMTDAFSSHQKNFKSTSLKALTLNMLIDSKVSCVSCDSINYYFGSSEGKILVLSKRV